jgi:hypothetical protein
MRAILRLTISGILLTAISCFAQSSAPDLNTVPDLNTIVNRMQTAMAGLNHDLAYSVTREYTLTPEKASKGSRVVAQVNTISSGKKDYTITEGNGQAENVVRKVLDHEAEASSGRNKSDINAVNYDFKYLTTEKIDGHTCYVLELLPRKDSKDFLKGKAWVDAESFLIRQVSGSPAKSPSWWVKDVQLTLHYRDMQGVWLQDSGKAVAQVRLVGTHTLTQRSVDVRTRAEMAKKSAAPASATKRNRRVDPALLGTGVFRQR